MRRMKAQVPHRWDVSPREAAALQVELRHRMKRQNDLGTVRTVAGADISLDTDRNMGYAGVIVYSFPDLREVERASAERRLTFPYVPGLLAFREGPVLLEAFSRLRTTPDLLLFDAHGYSHPRRFGLASHLSVVLDQPGIGVAKSRLIGDHQDPPDRVGAWTPLVDGEEVVGAVIRTRVGVHPIFVSIGHRIDLETAIRLTLACTDGFRIPKPTREADRYVAQLKRGLAPDQIPSSSRQSSLF
jgi:deoxyribonuclease V